MGWLEEIEWHEQTAKSGVLVQSQVPFVPPHWYDNPFLHIFWSYASWITLMLQDGALPEWLRIKTPRRLFEKYWDPR